MARDLGVPVTDTGSYYFISYNSEDADRVKDIVKVMHQNNIPLWYDKGIPYGKKWEAEIAVHIEKCKAVIFFLSKGVFQKEDSYVSIEYEMARDFFDRPSYVIFLDNIEKSMIPASMIRWFIEIQRRQNIPHTFLSDKSKLMSEIGRMLDVPIRTTLVQKSPAESSADHSSSVRSGTTVGADTSEEAKKYYQTGCNYFNGIGVKKDFEEGTRWIRKAAELGYSEAQYTLGYCYEKGRGVTIDNNQAVQWYRKAAEQGNVNAQFSLGLFYDNGKRLTKNASEALKWYRKAAEQGNGAALFFLSKFYRDGIAVPKSTTEYIKLLKESAANGYFQAVMDLGLHYETGQYVEKDIEAAKKVYRNALTSGDPYSTMIAQQRLDKLGDIS